MKPAWDQLGSEFKDSASVLIGDVDCTVERDLCSTWGVQGYPTIKYFTQDTGKEAQDYQSGRDFDSLKKFAKDTLEVLCQVSSPEGCSDKEQKYITKMKAKSDADVAKQLTRLTGMKAKSMKPALKQWVNQRLNILKQLSA